MLTEQQARKLAMKWKDPKESPYEPDPLAEFARTGVIDVDGVLEALAELDLCEPPLGARHRAEIDGLLEFFAEATATPQPIAFSEARPDGMKSGPPVGVVDMSTPVWERTEVWRTGDDVWMPFDAMKEQHIVFCIRWLRRRARQFKERAFFREVEFMSGPLGPRGDMATDGADRFLDHLLDTPAHEWIEQTPAVRALKAELCRRSEPWGVELSSPA